MKTILTLIFTIRTALLVVLFTLGFGAVANAAEWVAAGSLATARSEHTATLLPSGKVLIVGGQDNDGTSLASAELYDPATNAWSAAASLATARVGYTATLLPSGKVLVVGGYFYDSGSDSETIFASAELYNPATNTWSAAASLATGRYRHTATLLPSGKVLVVGGSGDTDTSTELYNPATNTWSAAANLADVINSGELHPATLLPSGKVLVVGGYIYTPAYGYTSRAVLYDPATNAWMTANPTLTNAFSDGYDITATLLPGGKVLVVGPRKTDFQTGEIYDSATNTWSITAGLAKERTEHTVTLLPSGKVLVVGGHNYESDNEGNITAQPAIASAELYDPATNFWSATASLATARFAHTATLLPSGKVLVVGGSGPDYNNPNRIASAELYIGSGAQATQPPTATTGASSNVATTSATVAGSVNANGTSTTVSFQYGATTSYGSVKAATPNTVSGSTSAAVSAAVTGLAPNTTYHYRVKAVSTVGTIYGDDAIFTTDSAQGTQTPVITSQPSAQGDISIGGQAFFSVSADGTGLNFQWYKDGKAISGAVGSSLSINPVTVANAGAYTCRISNSAGKVTTEAAVLTVVDTALLIYKVKATKTDNEGTTTKKSAVGGWLVLDRSGQQGAFIWTGKQGKQKTYTVERRADLATHSTGPVAKSTTLVVADQTSGDHPDVEHNLVWLRGGDALVKLSALDQTFAPLVMAGTIGRLTLGDRPMIQTLAVSLVLDKPRSTMSRTNADDMEKAITRITEVLNAAGYLEL